MKRYKQYMDDIEAPDTLRQRLKELEAPAKRPVSWKKYGTVAAALVLAVGVGAWGLSGGFPFAANRDLPLISEEEIAFENNRSTPDIAIVEPGELDEPGEKILGGYDVTEGSDGNAAVAHYILPYIDYGEVDAGMQAALDWDIPKGASRRDLTRDQIVDLMGGEDAVNTHLDWGEYELTGWGAWYEDGSFWGAYIDGRLPAYDTSLPMNSFEFAVTAGALPPTCFAYPDSAIQEIRGLTVTASKYQTPTAVSVPAGADAPERTNLIVSFMKDDYGYRFEMGSTDAEQAELLVSRLVCRIADEGLALTHDCPYCGHTFPFGTVHNDPFIGADSVITCSVCGKEFPVGSEKSHVHSFTGEGTIPGFVPDYDPTYEDGAPSKDLTICGLPLYDPNAQGDLSEKSPRDGSYNWCGTPNADSVGSIVPSLYQSEPPALRVLCSEGLADGRSGNYEWSCTDIGSGETSSVVACGAHPLDFQDAPSMTTADGTVTLNFFDLPDRVSVVCWPDSARGDTSAASQAANTVRGGQTYALTLKDGGWIYEINAQWDSQGRASYVFYIVKS